ncbi:unnamed protein product [Protopolystoma xenopodis]|uniref:Uncharacterized protein n=1 Tax=Protopolystoma xenopodis TaxID=117903 RepID=A0A3S5B546_9PLAT|nr:unnamed protein product [Protopolystoma xenopodis]
MVDAVHETSSSVSGEDEHRQSWDSFLQKPQVRHMTNDSWRISRGLHQPEHGIEAKRLEYNANQPTASGDSSKPAFFSYLQSIERAQIFGSTHLYKRFCASIVSSGWFGRYPHMDITTLAQNGVTA